MVANSIKEFAYALALFWKLSSFLNPFFQISI